MASGNLPMGPFRRVLREVGLGLITLGVVVLLFVAYELLGTNLAEAHSQAALAKSFHSALTKNHSAVPGDNSPTVGSPAEDTAYPSVPPGYAVAHLVIPKIGVDKFVVQGVNEEDLRRGPGHYPSTVMPGQLGNSGIAGHRTTYGAPFFRLNELKPGDNIYITDIDGRHFRYKVTRSFVVSPSDVAVLDPTPFAQLTLTTCNPRFSASTRLIVTARLAPDQTPLPPPREPTEVSAVTNLGRGESSAWPATIGFGMATVALWVLVRLAINRTRRWKRAATYVVGIGVCLVPLWLCFENITLLLPQNI